MPWLRKNPLVILFAVVAIAALAEYSRFGGALQGLEQRFSDLFVAAQAPNLQPDADIVVVDVDEASLDALAQEAGRWPWPRSIHGELVAGIAEQKPRAIVFDIMFSEPDVFRAEADEYFNSVVSQSRNVYFPVPRQPAAGDPFGWPLAELGTVLGAARTAEADPDALVDITLPRALAPENWQLGIINFLPDADGIGRRYYVYLDAYGWKLPSLPTRVVQNLGLGVPDVESIALSFPGGRGAYPHISYVDLLADFNRQTRTRDPAELRDKIVVIGVGATGLHDIRATSIDSLHPGVDILATAIDNLKNGNYLREVDARWPALATLVLLALMLFAFRYRFNTLLLGAGLALLSLISVAGAYLAAGQLLVFPVLRFMLFGWVFYFAAALQAYLRERREREQAVREFSRFVNPHVVNELIEHGGSRPRATGRHAR